MLLIPDFKGKQVITIIFSQIKFPKNPFDTVPVALYHAEELLGSHDQSNYRNCTEKAPNN